MIFCSRIDCRQFGRRFFSLHRETNLHTIYFEQTPAQSAVRAVDGPSPYTHTATFAAFGNFLFHRLVIIACLSL